ncbi:unnamed protein product [Prorocentrum cordatum]|uniref:non-specific serine/threonine protein kinase n=1 Tax=Prorocentrum cordatum TaxID=2364126 RepID=A0ABN9UV72_9DINO|nr:unnamed protein product [Polarella glacialis]
MPTNFHVGGRRLLLLSWRSALAGATLAASAVAPRGDAGARVHIAVDASGDIAPPAAAGRRPLMRRAGHGRDNTTAPAGADVQPHDALSGPSRARAGGPLEAGSVAAGSLAADVAQASGCGYDQMSTNASALASTFFHACTIHQSSWTSCCWGGNGHGETKVPEDLGPVQAIAAGGFHTCAIRQSDRTVQCWGVDWHGRTRVPGDLGRAEAVSAGRAHTCSIRQSDRTVQCWGGGAVALVLSIEKQKHEVGIEKKAAEKAREQAAKREAKVQKEKELVQKEKEAAEKARLAAQKKKDQVEKARVQAVKEKEQVQKEKEKVQEEKEAAEEARLAAQKKKDQAEKARQQAVKEKEAAEKEKLAAQQRKIQAEKQERQAKKEREEARRGKAVAVIEKSCSAELTRQVKVEISCAGTAGNATYAVPVPDGVMLFGSPVQAHRCTNRGACIAAGAQSRRWEGSEIEIGGAACPLGTSASNMSSPMCGKGYDDQSPGCSRCSEGYGRASSDAFVCQACGATALQLAGYMMIPLAIYIISVRGALARARTRSGIFNDLLKIFLSFGQGATVVMSAVVTSDSYQALPELPQKFLSSGDSSVERAALYPRAWTASRTRRWESTGSSCWFSYLLLPLCWRRSSSLPLSGHSVPPTARPSSTSLWYPWWRGTNSSRRSSALPFARCPALTRRRPRGPSRASF